MAGVDGVLGSARPSIACGVCRADGTPCHACAAGTAHQRPSNGAYVHFNVGAASHGTRVSFPDGNYYKYAKALCNRVVWGNVTLVCQDGGWYYSGQQSFGKDALCTGDKNHQWSSGGNSISTGWQP